MDIDLGKNLKKEDPSKAISQQNNLKTADSV
jgi:hypothetical protein